MISLWTGSEEWNIEKERKYNNNAKIWAKIKFDTRYYTQSSSFLNVSIFLKKIKKINERQKQAKNQRQVLERNIEESKETRDEEQWRQRENFNNEPNTAAVFSILSCVTWQLLSVVLSENNQSSNHQFHNFHRSTNFRTRTYDFDCCIM